MQSTPVPPLGTRKDAQRKKAGRKANGLLIFGTSAIGIPFANVASVSNSIWMASVTVIAELIFEDIIDNKFPTITILLHLLGLFVIFIGVPVFCLIARCFLSKYLAQDTSQKFSFKEYSTPITILAIAGAFDLERCGQCVCTGYFWGRYSSNRLLFSRLIVRSSMRQWSIPKHMAIHSKISLEIRLVTCTPKQKG